MRRVKTIAPEGCAESNFGQDSIVVSEIRFPMQGLAARVCAFRTVYSLHKGLT